MNLREKISIGGEFELNPEILAGYEESLLISPAIFLYASGRSALLAILEHIAAKNISQLYLPDFLCESIIKTAEIANMKLHFYHVEADLSVNISIDKILPQSAVLFIHYFGLIDYNALIVDIKTGRPDIIVIDDCVHAYYDMHNSIADYAFNSLRKFFAIHEGAETKTIDPSFKHKENIPVNKFADLKIQGAFLKYIQAEDSTYLHSFGEGEKILDEQNQVYKATISAQFLIHKIDFENIKKQRQINAEAVYEFCYKYKIPTLVDYNKAKTPLYVPVLVNKRDNIRKFLKENNIFLPRIWPRPEILTKIGNHNLYNNLLTIVTDQRYTINEINILLNYIKTKI